MTLTPDELRGIKVGDRIKFRSATRQEDRLRWRKVKGFDHAGQPTVRYHGWSDFTVRFHEIKAIERGN